MMYDALGAKGVGVINDPDAYRHARYMPENYPTIEGHTPRTIWLTGNPGIDRIMDASAGFGDKE